MKNPRYQGKITNGKVCVCVCGGGDCFTDKVNFSNQLPMGMDFIQK